MSGDWPGDDPFGNHDYGDGHLNGDDPGSGYELDHGAFDHDLVADEPADDDDQAEHPGHGDPAAGYDADPAADPDPDADADAADHADVAPIDERPPAYEAEPGYVDHDGTLPQHVDTSPFPPYLDVDVAPSDGRDWVDPHLLGEPEPASTADADAASADGGSADALHDLHAAEGADPAQSDDPAVRALALFWAGR